MLNSVAVIAVRETFGEVKHLFLASATMDDIDDTLSGTLLVEVIDWWTGDPLQGVSVRVAPDRETAFLDCWGCNQGALTDHRGYASFRVPMGPIKAFIKPDFEQEAWIAANETTEVTFECPDFVKQIRHNFD